MHVPLRCPSSPTVLTTNLILAIASILYRSQDAPRYILGGTFSFHTWNEILLRLISRSSADAVELMFVGMGVISLTVTVFVYSRINARREREMALLKEKGVAYNAAEFREMGDHAPDFRYTL